MFELSIKEIAELIGGELHGSENADEIACGVCIDSREAKPKDIFFALRGEQTDGHRFLHSIDSFGLSAFIVSRDDESLKTPRIVVPDTFAALQTLAKKYIARFDIPFVAVTGSSGKTTTKDITAAVLSAKYDVLKTAGNLNSTTGVPLTVMQLEPHHEIGVIEISMSHPHEIYENAEIVRPNTAIITNIGLCHVEFLGSRENIFRAKSEILAFLEENDLAIMNGDDEYLNRITSDTYEILRVGAEHGDLTPELVEYGEHGNMHFELNIFGKTEGFDFPYPGEHSLRNCLMAISVALRYGLTPEQIREGLSRFVPSKNRMDIERLRGVTLINDTYNANPDSMAAAAVSLCKMASQRKIAVIGDMYELGDMTAALHAQTAAYLRSLGIDLILAVGNYKEYYAEGFGENSDQQRLLAFDDKQTLCAYLNRNLTENDSVLFKASRGMALEEVYLSAKESLSR